MSGLEDPGYRIGLGPRLNPAIPDGAREKEALIRRAKEMDAATKGGEDPGLKEDEAAFHAALAANDRAVPAMGHDKLRVIAAELVTKVRQSVTIDWTLRESARVGIRLEG